jgi:[CysO sulfur-carrier protein]-S-L-cysteine hydrolase
MFDLEKKYLDEMISHAQSEAPDECCGILVGKNGRIFNLYQTTNAEHSPIRYTVEPNDLIQVYQEISDRGWELLGIYHSHIGHPAFPSPTDVKYAYFNQSLYFIVSLNEGVEPDVRAFTIRQGEITEQELQISEDI